MLPYRDSRLTRIILGIFFLIIIGYAYFEARGLLFGPSISFSSGISPVVQSSYIQIQGQANHIASLSVDGNPIQVTETGAFTEPYVLSPGDNRIVFDAKDKYGNTTEKVVEIVYTPSSTSTPPVVIHASSTLPVASSTIPAEDTLAVPASSSPDVAPGR
jgi:hypothetical protein